MFREKNIKVTGLEKAKIFRIKAGTFINPKRKIKGTGFINVSTYPTKIELDLSILNDVACDYLQQIAYNMNMSTDELKNLLENYNSETLKRRDELLKEICRKKIFLQNQIESLGGIDALSDDNSLVKYLKVIESREQKLLHKSFNPGNGPIIYRVSIPFWRLYENCYCGDLYVSKEDFFKGVLIFNKNFGKFCINVLPEHRHLLEEYYTSFIKMLNTIDMDEYDYNQACPQKDNKAQRVGHFCTVCLTNKKRAKQRTLYKALKLFKAKGVSNKTFKQFSKTNMNVINIKKIKN